MPVNTTTAVSGAGVIGAGDAVEREVRDCLDRVVAQVERRSALGAAEAADNAPSVAEMPASDGATDEAEALEGLEEADAGEAGPNDAPGCAPCVILYGDEETVCEPMTCCATDPYL